ncbi:hypothetical protein GOODEAATRI_017615 [Goodea atripinnis]|uniref:Uncharacterized protein n=1 Tax=Goodea atripinnis TaxID=208336 RepID=A0ABV0PEW6_9TELE
MQQKTVILQLGSKLPAGVSQPPQFAKPPWETRPQSHMMQKAAASVQYKNEPIVTRPLDHIPHIRNPKLRQYYLQGAPALFDRCMLSLCSLGMAAV